MTTFTFVMEDGMIYTVVASSEMEARQILREEINAA